jgi:integrase
VQKKIGPSSGGRGRPVAGYVTKRLAEDWLRNVLEEARRGTLPGMVQTGATFADAAAEWLRYIEHERGRKHSTVVGYQSMVRVQLLPAFGELPLESTTTPMIESWIGSLDASATVKAKALVLLHGIFRRAKKVWGPPLNPVSEVEKPPTRPGGDIDVFSPEAVWALGADAWPASAPQECGSRGMRYAADAAALDEIGSQRKPRNRRYLLNGVSEP